MRRAKWTEVEVDIDLEDFTDQELVDELSERNVSGYGGTEDDLRAIHEMMKVGKKEQAYAAMYDYIRNKLGTAI